jgi:hypothetical protein
MYEEEKRQNKNKKSGSCHQTFILQRESSDENIV